MVTNLTKICANPADIITRYSHDFDQVRIRLDIRSSVPIEQLKNGALSFIDVAFFDGLGNERYKYQRIENGDVIAALDGCSFGGRPRYDVHYLRHVAVPGKPGQFQAFIGYGPYRRLARNLEFRQLGNEVTLTSLPLNNMDEPETILFTRRNNL